MTEPALPELLSVVLLLQPLKEGKALQTAEKGRFGWGRAAHALLLHTLQEQEPSLAAELHDQDDLKPFTCSSLLGKFDQGVPQTGEIYRLRLTSFEARLSSLLLQALQPGGSLGPGSRVELDYSGFLVRDVLFTPEQSPWCASSGYHRLAGPGLLAAERPPRRLTLQFSSPTAFKSAGRVQPLPLPPLVFGHLLAKWNRFAPLALPEEVKRYAGECLAVSRFDLHSRLYSTKEQGRRSGAVGRVTYAAVHYDPYWMGLLQTLAEFSLFSGVGFAATLGMGQCRLLPEPSGRSERG